MNKTLKRAVIGGALALYAWSGADGQIVPTIPAAVVRGIVLEQLTVSAATTSNIAVLTIEPTYNIIAGVVTINGKTGEITWKEGYAPTQAAREFAEALVRAWPQICSAAQKNKNKERAP